MLCITTLFIFTLYVVTSFIIRQSKIICIFFIKISVYGDILLFVLKIIMMGILHNIHDPGDVGKKKQI